MARGSGLLNLQCPQPGDILAAGSRSMEITEGREEQKSSVIVGKKHSEESTETSDCGQTARMNLCRISNRTEHQRGLYLHPPSFIISKFLHNFYFEVYKISTNYNLMTF